ncbi:MAG: hypothetical protein RLY93_00135 [Sumerlaeia bacterium]
MPPNFESRQAPVFQTSRRNFGEIPRSSAPGGIRLHLSFFAIAEVMVGLRHGSALAEKPFSVTVEGAARTGSSRLLALE